ncbi:MAG: enoyl-CoA hydratase-related protein [Pseudomonadaceae bacterium]|nr:enoyl-CoA hydratase-related protein [Pseudomonadaceae bacterium]
METLTITTENRVRTVLLDRPKALNAFNAKLMDELADAFLDAAGDPRVSVLLLSGAGRAFSAGADLLEMGKPQGKPKHGLAGMLDAIVDFPKPFLLAINGVGAGIGATIAGLADVSFIARGARLRCPFSALGLTAEAASTVTFPRLMGRQQASWFLLSSEWMSAEDCVESGLIMQLCEDDELMNTACERAATLAALPLTSLVKTKALMMESLRAEMKAAIKRENAGLAELAGGPANREAIAAFAEKREPDFSSIS